MWGKVARAILSGELARQSWKVFLCACTTEFYISTKQLINGNCLTIQTLRGKTARGNGQRAVPYMLSNGSLTATLRTGMALALGINPAGAARDEQKHVSARQQPHQQSLHILHRRWLHAAAGRTGAARLLPRLPPPTCSPLNWDDHDPAGATVMSGLCPPFLSRSPLLMHMRTLSPPDSHEQSPAGSAVAATRAHC